MIRSVCVNIEHSFVGDLKISLECPNGSTAVLKEFNSVIQTGNPSAYLGYPYGGIDHHLYDGQTNSDSTDNIYGVGLDYCFSHRANILLASGDPANSTTPCYIGDILDNVTFTFDSIPEGFTMAGENAGTKTFYTSRPSDAAAGSDYYTPVSDFSELRGCPLNGEWKVTVTEGWGGDNGYLFDWSIDFAQTATFQIQAAANNSAWGTVEGAGTYEEGETVTLVATPNAGYQFSRWSDNSTDNPYQFVANKEVYLTAIFTPAGTEGILTAENGKVNIHVEGNAIVVKEAQGAVRLFDAMGRLLHIERQPTEQCLLQVPASGVYFVQVGTHPTQRVVVIKK